MQIHNLYGISVVQIIYCYVVTFGDMLFFVYSTAFRNIRLLNECFRQFLHACRMCQYNTHVIIIIHVSPPNMVISIINLFFKKIFVAAYLKYIALHGGKTM